MAHIIKVIKLKNLTVNELEAFFIFNDLSDMKNKEYTVFKETETQYQIRRGHYGMHSFVKEIFEIVREKISNSAVHNDNSTRPVYDCELRRKKR